MAECTNFTAYLLAGYARSRQDETWRDRTKTPMMEKSVTLLDQKAPYKGLSADSEEEHEPVSDIDTATPRTEWGTIDRLAGRGS